MTLPGAKGYVVGFCRSASSRAASVRMAQTISHRYFGMPETLPVSAMAMAAQEWQMRRFWQTVQVPERRWAALTRVSSLQASRKGLPFSSMRGFGIMPHVEPRLTQYLFDRASRTLTPLSGTFELSPVCNLACKMCYVRKTPAEVAASPRPPVGLIQWLSIAEQARDAGMLYLLLTGGEPFLWQDFWPLYERLSTMGFLISINSNGTLLDEARVARLAEHPPTRINITLYGAGNETYEALCGRSGMFDRVDRAITLLRQAGILVKLNCSLTPHNACDLERIVSYAAERDLILEVNTYMFPPLRRDPAMVGRNDRFTPAETAHYHMERYRLQRGEEDFTRFLQNILRGIAPPPGLDEDCVDPVDGTISCRAGNASFWVTWDGWLTPCGSGCFMFQLRFQAVDRGAVGRTGQGVNGNVQRRQQVADPRDIAVVP